MSRKSSRASPPKSARSAGKGARTAGKGQTINNHILLALPRDESKAVFPHLQFVSLEIHEILHEPGRPVEFGYFINDGMASLLAVMSDGKSVEAGIVGREGFVGPILIRFHTAPTRAVAQIAGSAFRIRPEALRKLLPECPQLHNGLHRNVELLSVQAVQLAGCHCLHDIGERLARRLLMSQDRIGSDVLLLTHDFLAQLLGARRVSVTLAAGVLQKDGLISWSRGRVKIIDREGLEKVACECYGVIRRTSFANSDH
jgi:CRP-like cAMP-binding protein